MLAMGSGKRGFYRLDPCTKVVALALFSTAVLGSREVQVYGMGTLALVIGLIVTRTRPGQLRELIFPVLIPAALVGFFHLWFTPGVPLFQWGGLVATGAGLVQGGLVAWRLLLVVAAAGLVALTTSPAALTGALGWLLSPLARLGLPVGEIALTTGLALTLIPTVAGEARRITLAREARCARLHSGSLYRRLSNYRDVLIPLVVATLRRADRLAVAMENRGYRPGTWHVAGRDARWGGADYLAVAGTAALAFYSLL